MHHNCARMTIVSRSVCKSLYTNAMRAAFSAALFAEYDFHLNGNLSHRGVDSFNLLKIANGWKIAAVAGTREVHCHGAL